MSESRVDLRVVGRVQGVGFRWWTMERGEEFGLRGTVRNAPDGSVEVRAAGRRAGLDRLRDALRRGPASARVDAVEELRAEGELPAAGWEVVR